MDERQEYFEELDKLVESWTCDDDWLFVLYRLADRYSARLARETEKLSQPKDAYQAYALRAMHDSISALGTLREAIAVELWG